MFRWYLDWRLLVDQFFFRRGTLWFCLSWSSARRIFLCIDGWLRWCSVFSLCLIVSSEWKTWFMSDVLHCQGLFRLFFMVSQICIVPVSNYCRYCSLNMCCCGDSVCVSATRSVWVVASLDIFAAGISSWWSYVIYHCFSLLWFIPVLVIVWTFGDISLGVLGPIVVVFIAFAASAYDIL